MRLFFQFCFVLGRLIFDSIQIATRAADHFMRIYYAAYDSDTRLADLPHFYRPTSSLTWNGKPFQGTEGLVQLVSKMPATKHEVQSFDCHPIPGKNASRSLYFHPPRSSLYI